MLVVVLFIFIQEKKDYVLRLFLSQEHFCVKMPRIEHISLESVWKHLWYLLGKYRMPKKTLTRFKLHIIEIKWNLALQDIPLKRPSICEQFPDFP